MVKSSGCNVNLDVPVLVPPPADADLDVPLADPLGIEPDDSPLRIVGGDTDVVDDLLHPAVRVLGRSQEIVEGRDVVADDVVVFEIELY